MSFLTESSLWDDQLYQVEKLDKLTGGASGKANAQALTLGSRTRYLKARIEGIEAGTYTVGKADQLTTSRSIILNGDISGSVGFDGTANVTMSTVLKNSTVTAGSYKIVTVDGKGIVTGGSNPTTLSGFGITDAAPSSHVGATGTAHGVATGSVNGFMLAADKTKLDGIAANANNYSHPISGATAGTYKSVTVDANGHVTAGTNPTTLAGYGISDAAPSSHVGSTGSAHGLATTAVNGFMSALDKVKLDGITAGAGNYTHPDSGVTAGTYKSVTVNAQGHVTTGTNPTTLAGYGIADATPSSHVGSSGTSHAVATTTLAGFLSAADKTKLDGIATGANNYTHPVSGATVGTYKSVTVDVNGHVTSGSNPTTLAGYGIVDAAPSGHVGATGGAHGAATTSVAGFMSSTDKTKLDGLSNYTHPNSGVGAGTYTSVTVNAQGHVTAGNNPTTLGGYGITDAAPSTHVGASGTAHAVATTSVDGFMSAADKTKLNGVATGANNYSHPTSPVSVGTFKSVTVDDNGHVTAGTNPTTLAGYGITDAKSSSYVPAWSEITSKPTTLAGYGISGPATMTGSGNDYSNGAFMANGNGAANTVFPTYGFHQPSLWAGSIQMRDANTFYFYKQGASAYADVVGDLGNFSDVYIRSDVRLKTEIVELTGGIGKVRQLGGKIYTKDGRREVGIIAQDLAVVQPESVRLNTDGFLSIAPGGVTALLIEAIKDVDGMTTERFTAFEERMGRIEKLLSELNTRLQ